MSSGIFLYRCVLVFIDISVFVNVSHTALLLALLQKLDAVVMHSARLDGNLGADQHRTGRDG